MPEFRGKAFNNSRLLAKKSSFPRWKSLTLVNTSVDDEGIRMLGGLAVNLEEIHIASNFITDLSIEVICGFPKLVSLLLDGVPNVTDRGISRITCVDGLRELYINGTSTTDASMEYASQCKGVWSLSASETGISDNGLKHLSSMKKLRIISMCSNPLITGHGMVHLPDNDRIDYYFDGCPITDEGIRDFLLKRLNKLERLSVSGTNITDQSLKVISESNSIYDLRVNGTKITDKGLSYFIGHKYIRYLYVRGTSVSADMIAKVKNLAMNPSGITIYSDL